MNFEWEAEKAAKNVEVHEVSFREASEVFADPLSSTVADPDHSAGELRYLIFGQTTSGRHLVVAFVERGGRFRIVSAREMTRRERKAYEQ